MFRQSLSSTASFGSLVCNATTTVVPSSRSSVFGHPSPATSNGGDLFRPPSDVALLAARKGNCASEDDAQTRRMGETQEGVKKSRFARSMEKAAAYERRREEKRDAALDVPRGEDYDPELPHLFRDPLQDVLAEGHSEEASGGAAHRTRTPGKQQYGGGNRQGNGARGGDPAAFTDQRDADVANALGLFLDRHATASTRLDRSGDGGRGGGGVPEGAVLVFDTSVLVSGSRWCDVLDVLLAHGNTIVIPPVVLNELDHHVKKYRRELDSAQQDREGRCVKRYRDEETEAVRGGGDRQHKARSLLIVGQRSLVLRDWLCVRMYDALVADEVASRPTHPHHDDRTSPINDDESSNNDSKSGAVDAASPTVEALRVRHTYGRGRVVCANHQDSEVAARRLLHAAAAPPTAASDGLGYPMHINPLQPQPLVVRNNDDSIMYVAMFLRRVFLAAAGAGAGGAPANDDGKRRAVLLLTDDRILAIKARAEGVVVASGMQLLQWK